MTRRAEVYVQNHLAGILEDSDSETHEKKFVFTYLENYSGPPVSLTMPIYTKTYSFRHFPPFFEGVLPEGVHLEALLRQGKIDSHDYFSQLITVGSDLVGDVTVKGIP